MIRFRTSCCPATTTGPTPAAPAGTVLSLNVSNQPEEGTDTALLAAGHPTITALRPVQSDLEWRLP